MIPNRAPAAPLLRWPVMLITVLGLSACAAPSESPVGTSGDPSPPRTASPVSMSEPAMTPVASEQVPPAATPGLDQMIEVLVTDLVMRSHPGTGDDSTIYPDRLGGGVRAWVLEGPVVASGYEWYRVMVLSGLAPGDTNRVGWIAAASRDGEPWIGRAAVACPPKLDFEALATLNHGERIVCLAGTSLEVEGWIPPVWGSGGCGQEEPAWLLCWLTHTPLVSVEPPPGALEDPGYEPSWDDAAALIHVNHPPGSDPPPLSPGLHLRVVGHVDGPAASTCGTPDYSADPPALAPDPVLMFACRAMFVADTVEILDH